MFLEAIRIIDTAPCYANKERYKATARASVDLLEIIPYLNSIVENPDYNLSANSLVFRQGISEITIKEDIVGLTKLANLTEAFELLDWLKDLINDIYESRSEIEPNYKGRKHVGLLQVYQMLPKKNCGKCGEQSCMAFARKLSNVEAEIDDCPLLRETEFQDLRKNLSNTLFS